MKKLILLSIVLFTVLVSNAQMYIPTNPKDRVKYYVEFLSSCKESMHKGDTTPNTRDNNFKRKNFYNAAISYASDCERYEPDSAEPYKLDAICEFYEGMSYNCYNSVNKYFSLTHVKDTLLLKCRAFAYLGQVMANHSQGDPLGEKKFYALAKNDLDELINNYHFTRLLVVRAYLNDQMLYKGINAGFYTEPAEDTIFEKREVQDKDAYVKIYGIDSYYSNYFIKPQDENKTNIGRANSEPIIYDYNKVQVKPFYKNIGCFTYTIASQYYKNRKWFFKEHGCDLDGGHCTVQDSGRYYFEMVIDSTGKISELNFESSTYESSLPTYIQDLNFVNTLQLLQKTIVYAPGQVHGKPVETKGSFVVHLPSDTINCHCN